MRKAWTFFVFVSYNLSLRNAKRGTTLQAGRDLREALRKLAYDHLHLILNKSPTNDKLVILMPARSSKIQKNEGD
jgi:hypothetical protein